MRDREDQYDIACNETVSATEDNDAGGWLTGGTEDFEGDFDSVDGVFGRVGAGVWIPGLDEEGGGEEGRWCRREGSGAAEG
jgi:hypothetical protein